ncbi:hypothetical protein MKX01_036202 [Papaver californicum]|nr:hypothetical protein MKX01_036202 [Papaver californicum]
MVVAEKPITEHDSLSLTRNLLSIAIFNISYLRCLFPEDYFNDKSAPALEMKIKELVPVDDESRRLIDWMKKVCFSYSNSDCEQVTMNISCLGNKKQGATFNSNGNTDITPIQMRSSACKMIRTLVQLTRTLDRMPEERTILMKLIYYEDVTVKSILEDPYQDENNDMEDDAEISLRVDSVKQLNRQMTIVSHSKKDGRYIGSLVAYSPVMMDKNLSHESDTQNDKHPLTHVRDWVGSCRIDIELNDVLTNFPDISVYKTKAVTDQFIKWLGKILDKLVKEEILLRTGKDTYFFSKLKKLSQDIVLKEDMDVQVNLANEKVQQRNDEDYLYMKALYHVLPMDYMTISKLQSKLEGEANEATVRQLIDNMARDGFVEADDNERLGKRVIQSELTISYLRSRMPWI